MKKVKKIDKSKAKTVEDLRQKLFKRPGFRKTYEEIRPQFQIIRALIIERSKKGMSQRKLAKKVGVTQSALARFESGKINPTLEFLTKIVSGLGMKLKVE